MKGSSIHGVIIIGFFCCLLPGNCFAAPAGNDGDFYVNGDYGHAPLNLSLHPGVQPMSSRGSFGIYPGSVAVANASYGAAYSSYGNAYYMLAQGAADLIYKTYINNAVNFHPASFDWGEKEGWGIGPKEYFHALSPVFMNSEGASTTELDEVSKWFYTLALFEKPVKEKLKATGLLMPTMQMIFRRTRVSSDAEYLSATAHPSAFRDFSNTPAMKTMAAQIKEDNIPPMVQMRVISDTFNAVANRDFFEPGPNHREKMYDSPVSISRIFRGREFVKKISVSAAQSYDVNGRPLTYHWKVLRGDPAHVRIRPLNSNGSDVEIEFDYQPEFHFVTKEGDNFRSNMAAVGAFVHNGVYYSAPGFVTTFTLNNEQRTYDSQTKQLKSISYNINRVAAQLSYYKRWQSDTFIYKNNQLAGWDRLQGGQTYSFDSQGNYVETRHPDGTPDVVRSVLYTVDNSVYVTWSPGPLDGAPTVTNNGSPSGTLAAGTVSAILRVATNETATCKYGTTTNQSYANKPNTFSTTGAMSHQTTVSGLTNGSSYNYYVRCQDTASPPNAGATDLTLSFSIAMPADISSPTISGISVTNITANGATILWTTNEPSTSRVEYGLTTSYGTLTTLNPTFVTNHSQNLISLQANRIYHYRVRSKDATGNERISSDQSFTTLSPPDTTPPTVTNNGSPSGTLAAGTVSALLRVTTNETATCKYGTTTNQTYASKPNTFATTGATSHQTTVTGLTNGSSYNYYVRCQDSANNASATDLFISFSVAQASGAEDPRPQNPVSEMGFIKFKNVFNPTKETLTIKYTMAGNGSNDGISLQVYNWKAEEIKNLEKGTLSFQNYETTWDGKNSQGSIVAGGIYMLVLKEGSKMMKQRVVVIK